MRKENGQQVDPSEVINRDNQHKNLLRSFLSKNAKVMSVAGVGVLAAELIGVPKQMWTDVGILSAGTLVYGRDFIRSVTDRRFWKSASIQELEQAIDQIMTDGIELSSIEPSFESRGGFPESQAKYLLAQRVRATKIHLARKGKLQDYERFKWADGVPINPEIKPTQEDLDEVTEWADNEKKKLGDFVQELAKRKTLYIECGRDFDAGSNKVYLFKDAENVFDYEVLPLIDVMQGFAATDQELHETVLNEKRFDPSFLFSGGYDGIYSKEGRQKLADFFGKPVAFYTGAEFMTATIRVYDVPEPKQIVHGGLVEHFAGYNREPYHCLETVEPTKAKAEKIGIELAKA